MKTRSMLSIMIAGLLLLPSLPARATVDSYVTIQLTCYRQVELTCVDDILRGRVQPLRVGNREMLQWLSMMLELNIPNGSRLFVTLDGDTYIVDRRGEVIEDVSDYLWFSFLLEYDLFHGTYNKETEQEQSTIYFPLAMTLDLPGKYCRVNGIAIERFSASRPIRDRQTFSGNIKCNVNGSSLGFIQPLADEEGEGYESPTYYEGRISLVGRETVYYDYDK